MKRGEVYYLRYDGGFGSTEGVGRPVLVVTSQKGIDSGVNCVQVLCLTTANRFSYLNTRVNTPNRKSWVLNNQIMTVDASMFEGQNPMYELTSGEMSHVEKSLKSILGFNDGGSDVDENDDNIELRLELDTYKKLYEKALDKIIELQLSKDMNVVEKIVEVPVEVEKIVEVEKVVEKIVEVPREMTEEEVLKWIDELESEKIVEGTVEKPAEVTETTHRVRRTTHGLGKNPTREQINSFKEDRKANLNTDEWWNISAITGMSMNNARRIVAYRKNVGNFKRVDDLINVDFVKPSFIVKYGSMLEV